VRRLAAVGAARRPGSDPADPAAPAVPAAGGWVPTGPEPGPEVEEIDVSGAPGRVVRPAAGVAAAAVAVVIGVVAWLHAQGSGEAVQLAPRGSQSPVSAGSVPPAGTAPPSAASAVPSAAGVVVDVEGRVRRRGVQRLPPGSRVADAVRAAGGTTPGAVLTALNLARLLADGEQLVVPGPGDAPPTPGPGSPAGGAGPATGAAPVPAGPLDLNTATEEGLDGLPGVGPVLAGRIVAWRTQHGRFTSVDELAEVPGIGPKALERLRPLVRV
jgi:competence protein ComEA